MFSKQQEHEKIQRFFFLNFVIAFTLLFVYLELYALATQYVCTVRIKFSVVYIAMVIVVCCKKWVHKGLKYSSDCHTKMFRLHFTAKKTFFCSFCYTKQTGCLKPQSVYEYLMRRNERHTHGPYI